MKMEHCIVCGSQIKRGSGPQECVDPNCVSVRKMKLLNDSFKLLCDIFVVWDNSRIEECISSAVQQSDTTKPWMKQELEQVKEISAKMVGVKAIIETMKKY